MQAYEIDEKIEEMIEAIKSEMTESTKECRAVWPLDHRSCPYNFWFDENSIMVNNDAARALDYYGGFEYVDAEHRRIIGDHTIYMCEDTYNDDGGSGRVDQVINTLRPFLKE